MPNQKNETYTAEEFARCCSLRGICGRGQARAWLRRMGMESAYEADFERCWRETNKAPVLPRPSRFLAMDGDGTNLDAPDSRDEDFSTALRREQRYADARERCSMR